MATKIKILVTGSDGQLGRCIRDIAVHNPLYDFVFTDISELDVTDAEKVNVFVNDTRPDWIVNCAGYTSVDNAESDQKNAMKLNADAVGYLVSAARSISANFIHISTDYVFDGTNPEQLTENEPQNPISVYGMTKLEGEKIALGYSKSIVLRTSWLYSEYGNNFVKTIRKISRNNSEINVVCDQWGTPTSAHDLSKAIMQVISKPSYGLFNFSNEGLTCWALFAEEILAKSNINCKVNHISTDQYNSRAKRPAYSMLSKKKFTTTFKVDIPEWESALDEVIRKLDDLEFC